MLVSTISGNLERTSTVMDGNQNITINHARAVHTLPWGTLESEEVEVEVKEPLGKVCKTNT